MAISVPELENIATLQWYQADQTGTETTRTTILKGKADKGTLFNNEIFDALSENRIGEYGWYAGHTIHYGFGKYDELEITCVELTVNYNKSGYWSRFEVSARTESRPLEEKIYTRATGANKDEEYRLWWNHHVIADKEKDPLTAGQITTLKTYTTLSQGTGITDYSWAKTNQALQSGKKIFLAARFPGAQSYGVPVEQINRIIYARSESTVKNIIKAVGTLLYPKDHLGNAYDENRVDDSKWLVTSATYKKTLGWYEAQLTYAYATGGWLSTQAASGFTGVYPEYDQL